MPTTDPESILRLALGPSELEALRRHAVDAYPEECCGFLLGRTTGDGAVVEAVSPARNEATDGRSSRYLISPEAVLLARARGRELRREVVGYYHSHPDGSAEPSRHDLADAWPATSYVIVPVTDGAPGEPRSWRLRADRQGFLEEQIASPGPRKDP